MADSRFLESVPEIQVLIAEGNWAGVNLLLGDFHPAEVAEHWETFTREERLAILRHFHVATAVDVLETLEHERQIRLLQSLREERATALLEQMAPDERADLFAEFPPALAERFLRLMEAEEAEDVRELLTHDPETAGGIMTTDFTWVPREASVGDAIRRVRENFRDTELVYYLYVLDEAEHLVGVMTMKDLLLGDDAAPVAEIMHTNLVTIPADRDQEEVAREGALYDLLALPVVDEAGTMLGIVTHDDLADVIEEETTEDIEKFGAVIPADEERPYLSISVLSHCRARIPWLVILLFLSSISGVMVLHYDEVVRAQFDPVWVILLLSLAPMLMATAGNAGTQSATVVIRDLATGDLELGEIGGVFLKELAIGLLMGLILAACAFARALVTHTASLREASVFGGIIATAIFVTMIFATTAGALLPLLVKRARLDPAVMSSPLIATLIDNIAILIYFTIGIAALSYLSLGGVTP